MYRKDCLKKAFAAVLAASMILTTAGCGTREIEAEQIETALLDDNENEIATVLGDSLGLGSDSECDKDETVYVFTDAQGKVSDVVVDEWLKNTDNSEVLTDSSNLTDIENVSGDETYEEKDGHIEWKADGSDIYYQGHTDTAPPVRVKVTYTLDGKEVTPEEIAGKSGRVSIRFDYINDSKSGDVYTPFAMATGLFLSSDNFSNVTVENGKVISDGDRYIIVGLGMPGLTESLGLDEDNELLPDHFTVNAKAQNFQYDMSMTLAATDLLGADKEIDVTEVEDKVDDLADRYGDGMDKLTSGIVEYTDGVGQLADGIDELQQGADKLNGGAKELKDGTGQLKSGSEQLSGGITAAKEGSEQVTAGAESLGIGADKIADGMTQYTEGVSSAADGAKQLGAGAESLESGAVQLQVGSKDLLEGVTSYTEGVSSAKDGADKVSNALSQQILPGMYNENAGNPGLVQGIDSLDAGLGNMQSQVNTMFDSLHGSKNSIEQQAGGTPNAETVETLKGAIKQASDTYASAYGQVYAAVFPGAYSAAIEAGASDEEAVSQAAAAAAGAAASNENVQAAAAAVAQYSAQLASYSQAYGADSAVSEMLGYEETFKNGVGQLKGGADSLSAGSRQIYGGLTELSKGAGELSTGLGTLDSNSEALCTGADQLHEGISQLKLGAGQLKGGISSLDTGLSTLAGNSDALNGGIASLSQGAEQLKTGSGKVTQGLGQLESGAGSLNDGLNKLDSGAGTLAAGTDSLASGTKQLKDGAGKLKSASPDLVNGGNKLNDATDELFTKLSDKEEDLNLLTDRFNDMRTAGEEYQSFGGKADSMKGNVKFIIKTEGVSAE